MSQLLHNKEQRNGKCTEDGTDGQTHSHVIACHVYPFAQSQLSVLSLPDQKAKKIQS